MKSRKVRNAEEIEIIIERMSYQVYEQFCEYDDLVILGVDGEGIILAQKLKAHLDERKVFQNTTLHKLSLPKHEGKKPEITFTPSLPDLTGKPVLLVDDVLNSGRTLSYCLSPLVEYQIPSLKVAVLVERTYRKFPVSSSITGLALSTTVEENVLAILNPELGEVGVFLS